MARKDKDNSLMKRSHSGNGLNNQERAISPEIKPYNTRGKRIKITDSLLELLKYSEVDDDNDVNDPDYKPGDDIYDEIDNEIEDETMENSEESNNSEIEENEENENNYFEYDFYRIKTSLVKYIKSNTGYKNRRMKKIGKAIDSAFEMFSDAKKEAMHEIAEAEPSRHLWKLGLGPEEIERLQPILNKLRDEIKTEYTVQITDILDSPLSDKGKRAALQMYDIIQNMEPYTAERIQATKELKDLINTELNNSQNNVEKELLQYIGKQIDLKTRILNLNVDPYRKSIIYDKYMQLEKLQDHSDTTAASLRDWLEHAIKIPFNNTKVSRLEIISIDKALIEIKTGLDKHLFGMNEVKEQILCIFNNRLKSNERVISGMKMAMLGSPGVGKTQIARCLAEILDLPFVQISLGGMVDSTILMGSNPTWVGGTPGRIVKALEEMKFNNGIIFLDEIDKLAKTPHGKEVQSALLHILDPTQNCEFKDSYMGHELSINLSNIFFITAANDVSELDPALLSRIPPIKIPDYSFNDKKRIVSSFIIPKLLQKAGLNSEDVIFPDTAINYLLSKLDKSGGVRNEEDAFSMVIFKLGLLLSLTYEQQRSIGLSFACTISKPVIVENSLIDELYKKNKDNLPSFSMYM